MGENKGHVKFDVYLYDQEDFEKHGKPTRVQYGEEVRRMIFGVIGTQIATEYGTDYFREGLVGETVKLCEKRNFKENGLLEMRVTNMSDFLEFHMKGWEMKMTQRFAEHINFDRELNWLKSSIPLWTEGSKTFEDVLGELKIEFSETEWVPPGEWKEFEKDGWHNHEYVETGAVI